MAAPSERMPPNSVEAERGILALCLMEPDVLDETLVALAPADFFRADHEVIFARISAMRTDGLSVDAVSLITELERRGELARIGGEAYVWELADLNLSVLTHSAPQYVRTIRQYADVRSLIAACTEIVREAYSRNYSRDELIAMAEGRIFAIAERDATDDTKPVGTFAREAMDRIEARRKGESGGIPTGFADLDFLIDGMLPGQLIYLAARTSVGKTAFALNVIEHAALVNGHPTLMVSLEMAGREQAERLLASGSRIDSHKLRTGARLDDREAASLRHAFDRLIACPHLHIDDSPSRTIGQIAANARRLRRRNGLELLVVDYLQLIDSTKELGRKASREERVAFVSRRLKVLAKELQVPILALSQLNRESEKRDGGKPRTSDLRESGSLEQDADTVLLLHRSDMADPSAQTNEAEVIVAKQRSGKRGVVRLTYRAEFLRFESWSPYIPPPQGRGEEPY